MPKYVTTLDVGSASGVAGLDAGGKVPAGQLPAGGSGDVVGPAGATGGNVVLFDGATGKLVKDGGALGTAAFTATTAYATSTQGGKADTAVQPSTNPTLTDITITVQPRRDEALELSRIDVQSLQDAMLQYSQAQLPTTHLFADGMYARVLPRPAGTLIVGKVHKREHFYIVTKGSVQIGKEIYRAGDVIVSQPGTKRAVLALEDSICMTVHRTDKTDISEVEADLVEPDESSPFGPGNVLKREQLEKVA